MTLSLLDGWWQGREGIWKLYIHPVCISCWELNLSPFMCLKIFICKGFITFFPFWMPSFVTAKASTFPALYQAMPVHKQQHLTVQRAFFYPLDCSRDVRGVPTTDWKPSTQADDQRPQSSLAYPSLVCLSGNFLRLGCKRTHLQFWSRCNLSHMLKENLLW